MQNKLLGWAGRVIPALFAPVHLPAMAEYQRNVAQRTQFYDELEQSLRAVRQGKSDGKG